MWSRIAPTATSISFMYYVQHKFLKNHRPSFSKAKKFDSLFRLRFQKHTLKQSKMPQQPPANLSPEDVAKVSRIELQTGLSHEVQILALEDLLERYGPLPYLLARLGMAFIQAGAPAMALDEYRKTQQQLVAVGLRDDTFNDFVEQFEDAMHDEFKRTLDSASAATTYYQEWKPTKLHKFPLNLPHLPPGHQEVKDEWSRYFHPQSELFNRYMTNLAIETCHVESTFLLTPESVNDLICRGLADGLVVTTPESAVTEPDKIKRIISDVIAAHNMLTDVVADPSKLDRKYTCRVHEALMRTCRFDGEYYNPPGVTRTKTGRTVVISHTNYMISCCSYLYVDEELDYICKMAKQYIKNWRNPFASASWVHLILGRCHPFDGGNGLVARLISSIPLLMHGYPPVSISLAQRPDYYTAVSKAYNGDYGPLSRCLINGMTEMIKDVKSQPFHMG